MTVVGAFGDMIGVFNGAYSLVIIELIADVMCDSWLTGVAEAGW